MDSYEENIKQLAKNDSCSIILGYGNIFKDRSSQAVQYKIWYMNTITKVDSTIILKGILTEINVKH